MKTRILPFCCFAASLFFFNIASAQLTISSPTTFASLDNSANDSDPTVGVFQYAGNLTIAAGGSITNNDIGIPNASAGNSVIHVDGNLEIQSGGSILAENNVAGGSGGNITITVGANFIMTSGALISASKTSGSGDTGNGGNISIEVEGLSTISTGASVRANSPGSSGDIIIITHRNSLISGTVESSSGMSGTGANQPQGAGSIFIISDCNLVITSTGIISSRGRDPGADLVHLEACIVTISGLVESTGAGHALPTIPTKLVPQYRPDKSPLSTAGIEVWGNTIVINSTGQLNADLPRGENKRSWIDIFARNNINIAGPASGTLFAVHANVGGNGGQGGIITVKSAEGLVNVTGQALQANSIASSGIERGGLVTVEANTNLNFTGSTQQAIGSNFGGTFNFKASTGNSNMDAATFINVTANGTVTNTACLVAGAPAVTGAAVNVSSSGTCTPAPVLPAYVVLPLGNCVTTPNCDQNIVLPVTLVAFSAKRINSSVLLKWNTVTEINNRGFEIQRRVKNNTEFETIHFVESQAPAGTSNATLSYSYTDPNGMADLSFYRIKQVDLDGKLKYSEIRVVNGLKNSIGVVVYPNPSQNGLVNVTFTSDSKKDISLVDMAGRELKSWKAYKDPQVTITGLKTGTYMLRVIDKDSNETIVQKIIVSN